MSSLPLTASLPGGDGAIAPRWTALPLVLVIVTLVGSVVVPARQTLRIMDLLRETTETVEPARLLNARLELGLTKESASLEGYAFSADTAFLDQYHSARTEDERQIDALGAIARRLDEQSVSSVAAVRARVAHWRQTVHDLAEGRLPRARLDSALRAQEASYDAVLRAVAGLTAHLSDASAERRERIRAAERLSLVTNTSLVLVALSALLAVGALSRRERRLSMLLRRRVEEEVALRAAAEALTNEKESLLEEARQRRDELERVMASRSRLMRGFSHDVKNPLIAADGYAALLSDGIYGALGGAQTQSITAIRRCVRSALTLIDDLHELARAETGHVPLLLEPVDAVELARTTTEDYRAAAEARGLALVLNDAAAPVLLVTDQARVRQIIGNLLSNAIKYTRRGSVTLGIRRERARPDGDAADDAAEWACIDVTDTGPGIPPEKHEAIFEEFTRLGASETTGAGLGLAISQRLAEALGGRITVASEVGRGCTFTLRLPIGETAAVAAPSVPAAA